jgi:hypothetical protein
MGVGQGAGFSVTKKHLVHATAMQPILGDFIDLNALKSIG